MGHAMTASTAQEADSQSLTLSGFPLRLVQVIAIGLTLLSVGLAIAGIRPRIAELTTLCEVEPCLTDSLTPERLSTFESLRISPVAYVIYLEALAMTVLGLCVLAGGILFLRRPTSVIAIVTAVFVIQVAVEITFNLDALGRTHPTYALIEHILTVVSGVSALLVFTLFPDGRFVPRWVRWPVLVWSIAFSFETMHPSGQILWPAELSALFQFALFGLAMVTQVYRFRRVSTPAQRQQTRWILTVISFQIVIYGVLAVWLLSTPLATDEGVPGLIFDLVGYHIYALSFLLIPASFYFSILRYRLWNLEFYLNRTLIYGTGLAVLAGLYFLVEFVAFGIVQGFGMNISQPLIAGLAALIVGLIALPAYDRLKDVIDERFSRDRLNRLKTPYLAALAEQVRSDRSAELIDTAANRTLEEDLARVLDGVQAMLPADAANLMLVENGQATVHLTRGYEQRGLTHMSPGLQFSIADTVSLSRMAKSGESLLIPDIRRWRGRQGSPWLQSYVGVPIMIGDHLLGFMNVDSLQADAFDARHVDQLEILASYAATAIANARLSDRSQQMAAELINLEARNIELDSFSQMVAHDLRGPIQIISGFADILNTQYAGQIPKEVKSMVEYIHSSIMRMDDLIDDLLLLTSTEALEGEIQPVNMQDVIVQVLKRVRPRAETRGVLIETDSDFPLVMGHEPWLEEVMANLVENAIKYIGDSNEDPRVHIRCTRLDQTICIEIEDNGLGIPIEMQAELFQPFKRFHPQAASGTGLGLSIVRRIVEKLGGTITANSQPGKGSTFRVCLMAG